MDERRAPRRRGRTAAGRPRRGSAAAVRRRRWRGRRPPTDAGARGQARVAPSVQVRRKPSLDELPQYINLVKGEMSLVGPRPTSFSATTYDLWHTHRLEVRPGITGLWQGVGRHTTTFDQRLSPEIQSIRKK